MAFAVRKHFDSKTGVLGVMSGMMKFRGYSLGPLPPALLSVGTDISYRLIAIGRGLKSLSDGALRETETPSPSGFLLCLRTLPRRPQKSCSLISAYMSMLAAGMDLHTAFQGLSCP